MPMPTSQKDSSDDGNKRKRSGTDNNQDGDGKKGRSQDNSTSTCTPASGDALKAEEASFLQTPITSDPSNADSRLRQEEWEKKLNLSPPVKKNTTNQATMTIQEAETQMRTDEMSHFIVQEGQTFSDEQRIMYYLYGSGFAAGDDRDKRHARIAKFLDAKAKQRMMDILKKSSDASDAVPKIKIWRYAQRAVLCYERQEGGNTIFKGKHIPLMSRCQQVTQNCYMHATGATISYKAAFEQLDMDYKVCAVDISKLVRHTFVDERLEARVVENKGGDALVFLKEVVGGRWIVKNHAVDIDIAEGITTLIKLNGPALVRRFRTDEHFKRKRTLPSMSIDNKTNYIHQFDRIDDEDTYFLFALGSSTQKDEALLQLIEERNCTQGASDADSISVETARDTTDNNPDIVVSSSTTRSSDTDGDDSEGENENEDRARPGLHSMVLIGSRTEGEKTWLLIQNTWTTMPLFEASVAYLEHHCDGRPTPGGLLFLKGNSSEIPCDVTHTGLILESTYDDAGDCIEETVLNDSDLEGCEV